MAATVWLSICAAKLIFLALSVTGLWWLPVSLYSWQINIFAGPFFCPYLGTVKEKQYYNLSII
jgi:hypothetical protein